MEVKEFVEETSRIESYYNKELDEFQRKIWFEELKVMDIKRYRQIVRQVFRECKFMPKLADILDIQSNLPYAQKQEQEYKKVECNKCNSKGFKFYIKKQKNGDRYIEYSCFARCDCENGQQYAYDGSNITDSQHRSKFYVPTLAQIGI